MENLQSLRIPAGWTFLFNKLEDIEPDELSKQAEIYLGWYPDGDPNGEFRLIALLNENWELPLLEFSSRSKKEIVEMLEQWLFQEFMPLCFIDEDTFRKNHSHLIH